MTGPVTVEDLNVLEAQMLAAIEAAYLHLLQTPHDTLRIQNQWTFCLLRDAICAATGREPQDVQDDFEERALKIRFNLK